MSDTISALDALGASWMDYLLPASWRGVPFVMKRGQVAPGRKVAIHQYPYRDDVWVEDQGLAPQRFAVEGFLVGDDVYLQRQAMIEACNAPGPGELVHPSLGSLIVSLVGDPVIAESDEAGRTAALRLEFIQTSAPVYPDASITTGDVAEEAADDCDTGCASDFANSVADAVETGIAVVNQAVATVGAWAAMAMALVQDAGMAANAVHGLIGSFGRYDTGGRITALPVTATVGSVLASVTTARTAVANACADASRLAGLL